MGRNPDFVAILVDFITRHTGVLFHQTDEANLPSIEKHGLLSKQEAQARNIVPIFPGGDELTQTLDWEKGLGDYVFVGFHRSGVMPAHKGEWRRRPRMLYIDPKILYLRNVEITLARN